MVRFKYGPNREPLLGILVYKRGEGLTEALRFVFLMACSPLRLWEFRGSVSRFLGVSVFVFFRDFGVGIGFAG